MRSVLIVESLLLLLLALSAGAEAAVLGQATPTTTPPTPYAHNGPANATVQTKSFYRLLGRVFNETNEATLRRWFKVTLEVDLSKNHTTQGSYDYYVNASDLSFHIVGTSANAAGAGLHHFMRHYLNSSVTWGRNTSGWNVRPLSYWIQAGGFPSVAAPSVTSSKSLGAYRYYMNVCTLGYTMGFWGWAEWERHIDWMTLHGINLPLASVGTEYVWWKTWTSPEFNLTSSEVLQYFTGPAFFPWNRMGNIQSWAGPVSVDYLENRRDLQRKLLRRMSEMGMSPILPAFAGFVPRSVKTKFPNAKIIQGPNWLGDAAQAQYTQNLLVDPTDPLFPEIANVFMRKLTEIFGTSDFYNADTYNEMVPTQGSRTYLHDSSNAVHKGLTQFNPNATWVMQGWLFVVDTGFWTASAIQAYLGGVPKDGLLILDLTSDYKPQFERTDGYYGYHWIWCMLHNYGGKRGIYGNMADISTRPVTDYAAYPSMTGTGMTMEAIDQNIIIYELMLEMAWRAGSSSRSSASNTASSFSFSSSSSSHDSLVGNSGAMSSTQLDHWVRQYVLARYNPNVFSRTPDALGFTTSLYQPLMKDNGPMTHMVRCCYHFATLIDRPWLENTNTWVNYNADTIYRSWNSFLQFYVNNKVGFEALMASEHKGATFRYDVMDFTRQFISNIFTDAQQILGRLSYAYVHNPSADLKILKKFMVDEMILEMLEQLMGSDENFLLGNWMDQAIRQASPRNSADLTNLEYNAKAQLTIWGPGGTVHDYAGKPWAGLLKHYHYPRWSYLFKKVESTWPNNLNENAFGVELLEAVDTPFAKNTSSENFSVTPTLENGIMPVMEKMSQWMALAEDLKRNATVYTPTQMNRQGQLLMSGMWHGSDTPVPALLCAKMQPSCWAWDSVGNLYGSNPKGTVGNNATGFATLWVVNP